MCGIVGYIGSNPAVDFLLEGLRRLEYRGYDSSGIVTVENGQLSVTKTAGRVEDLPRSSRAPNWTGRSDWDIPVGQPTVLPRMKTPIHTSAATRCWHWFTMA